MRPADKLQLKAATILPLVGLARSKQDPINGGHGAQYLYHPPPAGAKIWNLECGIGGPTKGQRASFPAVQQAFVMLETGVL